MVGLLKNVQTNYQYTTPYGVTSIKELYPLRPVSKFLFIDWSVSSVSIFEPQRLNSPIRQGYPLLHVDRNGTMI